MVCSHVGQQIVFLRLVWALVCAVVLYLFTSLLSLFVLRLCLFLFTQVGTGQWIQYSGVEIACFIVQQHLFVTSLNAFVKTVFAEL